MRHYPQVGRKHHAFLALVVKLDLSQFNVGFCFALRPEEFTAPFAGNFVAHDEFKEGMFIRLDAKRSFHLPQQIAKIATCASKMCFYLFLRGNIR